MVHCPWFHGFLLQSGSPTIHILYIIHTIQLPMTSVSWGLVAHEARLLGIDLHKGLIDVADELLGWAQKGEDGDPVDSTFCRYNIMYAYIYIYMYMR